MESGLAICEETEKTVYNIHPIPKPKPNDSGKEKRGYVVVAKGD